MDVYASQSVVGSCRIRKAKHLHAVSTYRKHTMLHEQNVFSDLHLVLFLEGVLKLLRLKAGQNRCSTPLQRVTTVLILNI